MTASPLTATATPAMPVAEAAWVEQEAPHETVSRDEGLIYDIGMDLCQDTEFYLKKGFRVVAVDANPTVCEAAAQRYPAEVAAGQLTVLNRAVSESPEPLTFYVCTTLSAWSTASPKLRDQWSRQGAIFEEIRVPVARMADIVERYGVPYFAKIDIEGFDLVALRGFLEAAVKPRYVSTEVDFYEVDTQLALLTELGYRRFALVSQSTAPQQTPPRPAREGRDVDHTFALHASGLFGRELDAEWISAGEVRARCAAVINHYRVSRVLGWLAAIKPLKPLLDAAQRRYVPLSCDWYDIHAAL